MGLNEEEMKLLLYLVRNRLRYEAGRQAKFLGGRDIQNDKTRALADLKDKIEEMLLAL